VPIALVSYRVVGRAFLLKSLRTILIGTLFVDVLFARVPAYTGDPLLAALFMGVFLGSGLALVYMRGSSTGGADFLVMAATLLDIKSRMLLPKVEKEEEEDEEDPRAELVRRLLEYKMYKYMAQELEEREQEAELLFFKEPTIPREVAKYEEPLDLDKLLDGLTLAKLQKVFDAVMKRNANKLDPVRSRFSTIRREPISLEQKVKSVLSYAREHRHFKFSDVLERESDRLEIVVAFLAVLELMKMGRIHLVQEKLFDEIQLDTVDVDEMEDEAELELSTEEGEEYARIR